jgi:hypothetical protein
MDENHLHVKEHVVLPSDAEERQAKKEGKSYVKLRSGRVKIYTREEIDALNHPEASTPFRTWDFERKWNWLINSKSCRLGV